MLDQIVGNHQVSTALPVAGPKICLEEPMYPGEFVSIIRETGFEALQELLMKIKAPQEALGLLEDLAVLCSIGNVEDDQQVSPVTNQILSETIASASRNITKVGGIFYGPSGTTIAKDVQFRAKPRNKS